MKRITVGGHNFEILGRTENMLYMTLPHYFEDYDRDGYLGSVCCDVMYDGMEPETAMNQTGRDFFSNYGARPCMRLPMYYNTLGVRALERGGHWVDFEDSQDILLFTLSGE